MRRSVEAFEPICPNCGFLLHDGSPLMADPEDPYGTIIHVTCAGEP